MRRRYPGFPQVAPLGQVTPLGFGHCDGGPPRCAPAFGATQASTSAGRDRASSARPPLVLAAPSLALAAAAAFGVGAPSDGGGSATPSSVALVGHGYGHGIGMGQWGSLGYALGADGGAGNFTYSQILTHYYGNTTLETLGTAPAPAAFDGGNVRVAMTENNGANLIATAASGTLTVPGVTATATAVFFNLVGPGSIYNVYTAGREDLCRPDLDACRRQRHRAHGGRHERRTGGTLPAGPPSIELHGSLTALAHVARAGPHDQHRPARGLRGRRRSF